MIGKYLLDTSVAIAILRGDAQMQSRLLPGRRVCTSITVLGELLTGAIRSSRPELSRNRIMQLLAICPLIVHTEQTAEHYAQIKSGLAAKGKPIPENDIWIAAASIQYGLMLAARDQHFAWIEGLDFEAW